ncbi:P-loop containing nucleoside triphosphate hydrolase protein [Scheffersomyces coipomensis]|uniref:P-loop containing nucleoside triphosphate hydrolase protein n=1 Tax=Scheffersomyces coipomensis TaxID=1788519 RepID=UPI00315DF50D
MLTVDSSQVSLLSKSTLRNYQQSNPGERYIISIAGIPGAGKTTFASRVAEELNKSVKTMVLPQDGFHLYRKELLQLPNPEEAVARRGAPFTFNANAFVELISKLNDPQYVQTTIKVPSFDHSVKDPVEDDIEIDPETKIVIIEGNYVSLKDPVWNDIEKYCNESWFIKVDLEEAALRLANRHLESGIAQTLDEALERAKGSDYLNAQYILANSKNGNVLINSK